MMHRFLTLFKFVFLFSFFIIGVGVLKAGNGKKVYADFHGVRYTRNHDGMLGRWSYSAKTETSSTGISNICYNADNVLENGQHQIAAVDYPQVGMQSNLDPDYIEYQILSAKTAKIDGFFIEWGFMLHENDILLKAMQKVAQKYDFKIGVNWCDGWLYYNWITRYYPEITTREKKTEHYVKCYQYLVDSVFAVSTAPVVKGNPVFYLFGPGATTDEYKWVRSQIKIPQLIKAPIVLRRWADWGKLKNDKYIAITKSKDIDQWIGLSTIPTSWLPARVRPMDKKYPFWDNYALSEDVIEWMKPFRDSVWNSPNPEFRIKSGFVMPGMDNRGCAGWGKGIFYYIPRENGNIYRKMWEFNLKSKDKLDMIFIASWSDYTEGHEIEPTIENGDRELKTTLKYAAEFKDELADESGIELPLILFKLRKQYEFLSKSNVKFPLSISVSLEEIAQLISKGEYGKSNEMLKAIKLKLDTEESKINVSHILLTKKDFQVIGKTEEDTYRLDDGFNIKFKPELIDKLNRNNYKGYITFEYLNDGQTLIRLISETKKNPRDLYKVVAEIKKSNSNRWEKVKIELYKDNILYINEKPAFKFYGNGIIRNISIEYNLYQTEVIPKK